MIFQVVAQFEVYVKAKLGVIPSGAVLQAEGGISRVPNPHFAARNTPRPLVKRESSRRFTRQSEN